MAVFSKEYQDLSGIWEFTFTKKSLESISLADTHFDSFATVPGCFDLLPGSKFQRGTGIYRKTVTFSGPAELTLHGIGLRGAVYWDGKLLGEIDAPFSKRTFRFDAGEGKSHELIIAVNNEFDTAPSSLFKPNYDFYAHGGIFRKVTIAQAKSIFAEYVKLLPLDIEKGTLEVSVKLGGEFEKIESAQLFFDDSETPHTLKISNGTGKAIFQVPDHKVWSPESPELHKAVLKTGDWEYASNFGFRQISIADGKLFFNGKRLKIAGTNRHDAHPDFGYAAPRSIRLQDLLMLKAQGFNCIRGCHYPQDEEFLDMCDTLGMMVWEESLGWGNKEEDLADPLFRARQLKETERMVRKSINHPCVIMWGFLNECASETPAAPGIIAPIAAMLREADPSRPITFASHRLQKDICLDLIDIISFNTYPCWYAGEPDQFFNKECLLNQLKTLAEYASAPEYRDKPLIISEIGAEAIPGNHSEMRWSEEYQAGLLSETMKFILDTDRYTGTFLWQFCDSRTYVSCASQCRTSGFNNKGMVTGGRMPKASWHAVGKVIKEYLNGQ